MTQECKRTRTKIRKIQTNIKIYNEAAENRRNIWKMDLLRETNQMFSSGREGVKMVVSCTMILNAFMLDDTQGQKHRELACLFSHLFPSHYSR